MTKKPAPKKPAAKMPTIPRTKPQSVDDIIQELDADLSTELSPEALAQGESAKPAEKPSRPPHNLQTMTIIYPAFNKNPALLSYAGGFLDACFAVIDNPHDRTNFPAVKKRFKALSLDDPGWLDQIREAIADCASYDDGMKQAILAIFEMAVLLLYDIEEP
jgi:hypothetical protein